MPVSPSPPSRSSVVNRLRAAGCVFAEEEAAILLSAASTPADLAAMVDRRAAGVPLEHILGWTKFCSLRIALEPGVFVPRPRTEFLVREAVALAAEARRAQEVTPLTVVDLCCGSGAVGVAIAVALQAVDLQAVDLHAVDVGTAAVRCARRNLASVGGRAYQGDLYEPLPAALRGRVDLVVANAPYVPTDEVVLMPPEARVHEPRVALDGGPDGLDVLRRVTAGAPLWLAPGGSLLVETSTQQAPETVRIVERSGLTAHAARSDDLVAAVVIGTNEAQERGRRDALVSP